MSLCMRTVICKLIYLENSYKSDMDAIGLRIFVILCLGINKVSTDGKIELKLDRYENQEGEGDNGHCCDGKFGICESGGGCDTYLDICLDTFTGGGDIDSCAIGRRQTPTVDNMATIVFSSVQEIPERIVFSFTEYTMPGVYIKVEAWDDDSGVNNHDLIDNLKRRIDLQPARTQASSDFVSHTINSRTKLMFKIRAYCDPNYYGHDCSTFCKPRDDSFGHFECDANSGKKVCHNGWGGVLCNEDIDECISNPCLHGGVCEDRLNGYTCTCRKGYTGDTCGIDINECSSSPCVGESTCIDQVADYTCLCEGGRTGQNCEININDCAGDVCLNGGHCTDHIGSFSCECQPGYEGDRCEQNINECLSNPCRNKAMCTDGINGFICHCKPGWTGNVCDVNIDDCANSPCHHNSTCSDMVDGYSCMCTQYWTGTTCDVSIDDCIGHQCQNGATCQDGTGEYQCFCAEGFDGQYCQRQPDPCMPNPCNNNGKCDLVDNLNCTVNDTWLCHSVPQHTNFTCTCPPAWTGGTCDTPVNECLSNPCANNGSCVDSAAGFVCICGDDYIGELCELHADPCWYDPCLNDGVCYNSKQFSNMTNNDTIEIVSDHTNDTINILSDYTAKTIKSVVNFTEYSGLSFRCDCKSGFTGHTCELNIDDCMNASCPENATCVDGINRYNCTCSHGWSGVYCEVNIDDCAEITCLNGGHCADDVGDFSCECTNGWRGRHCEVEVDGCVSNPCLHGATCVNVVGNATCECEAGWTGRWCETVVKEKAKGHATLFDGKLHLEDDLIQSYIEAVTNVITLDMRVDVSVVEIDCDIKYCYSADGDPLTILVFRVLIDGTYIEIRLVDEAINRHKHLLPNTALLPMTECKSFHVDNIWNDSWLKINWYILVIVAVVTTIFIIIVVLSVKYSRKSFKAVYIPTITSSDSTKPGIPEGAIAAMPENESPSSQYFENLMYGNYNEVDEQQQQQPYTEIPESKPSIDDTIVYSEINEKQLKNEEDVNNESKQSSKARELPDDTNQAQAHGVVNKAYET